MICPQFIVCFIAGIGAGLGTGFAGMSAAAVISPMLIKFLNMPAYEAVGIALASNVLASAVSAYTYGKNKNLDIKNGLIMMISVLAFTLFGSFIASLVENSTMGNISVFMTFLLGIKFIVKPVMTTKESMGLVSPKKRVIQSIISGVIIGFICGFVGAISHFAIDGMPDIPSLIFCVLSTLLWAKIAAKFANKASAKTLNRLTGVILVILGIVIIGMNIFNNY